MWPKYLSFLPFCHCFVLWNMYVKNGVVLFKLGTDLKVMQFLWCKFFDYFWLFLLFRLKKCKSIVKMNASLNNIFNRLCLTFELNNVPWFVNCINYVLLPTNALFMDTLRTRANMYSFSLIQNQVPIINVVCQLRLTSINAKLI